MYAKDLEPESKDQERKSLKVPLLGEIQVDLDYESNRKKLDTKVEKARRYAQEHRSKVVIGVIYFLTNIALYLWWAITFWNTPNMFVTVARGFGMVLNFNCALILVPVLRNIITALRGTFLHRFIPFDSNIMFHRRIGWVIAFAATGHTIAHYFNYSLQDSPYSFAWATLAGITGTLICWIMVIMYTTAIDAVRRRYYNVFWFSHHLFILFFILLLLHGPRFWIFFTIPGIVYTVERILRQLRGFSKTSVYQVKLHPSEVVELRMKKKKFNYKAGQYLYLNSPNLSFYEWHPFTITSAPHEEFVSVHIRAVGPWTHGIRRLLAPDVEGVMIDVDKVKGDDGRRLIRMDGPYGAASEEVSDYKVLLLVGAGIGVTPFASILKDLLHKHRNNHESKVKKVYFFWICREYAAFEWFQELLRNWEIEMEENADVDFLSVNNFLTERMSKEKLAEIEAAEGLDPLTGLKSRTQFGRPDFDAIFDQLSEAHPDEKVGLFFCGPRILAKSLRELCMKKSALGLSHGTKFVFHKENF